MDIIPRRLYDIPRDEFDDWTLEPEQYDGIFEYIGGVVVERLPYTYPAVLSANMILPFYHYMMNHDPGGHVLGAKAGYVIAGDRYVPHLSYLSSDRIENLPRENCYLDVPPNVAVHMIHPPKYYDMTAPDGEAAQASLREAVLRVPNYLSVGTMVWYVYYDIPEVHVFSPDKPVIVLGAEDTITGGDVLPGFEMPVKKIFSKLTE